MPQTDKDKYNAYNRAYYAANKDMINKRYVKLLGVLPDKELATMTGISQSMVSWYRRKAGFILRKRAA